MYFIFHLHVFLSKIFASTNGQFDCTFLYNKNGGKAENKLLKYLLKELWDFLISMGIMITASRLSIMSGEGSKQVETKSKDI